MERSGEILSLLLLLLLRRVILVRASATITCFKTIPQDNDTYTEVTFNTDVCQSECPNIRRQRELRRKRVQTDKGQFGNIYVSWMDKRPNALKEVSWCMAHVKCISMGRKWHQFELMDLTKDMEQRLLLLPTEHGYPQFWINNTVYPGKDERELVCNAVQWQENEEYQMFENHWIDCNQRLPFICAKNE